MGLAPTPASRTAWNTPDCEVHRRSPLKEGGRCVEQSRGCETSRHCWRATRKPGSLATVAWKGDAVRPALTLRIPITELPDTRLPPEP